MRTIYISMMIAFAVALAAPAVAPVLNSKTPTALATPDRDEPPPCWPGCPGGN